jgi:outer membrane lipoprotein-sorting protein
MRYFVVLVLFLGCMPMFSQVKAKPKSKVKILKPVDSKNIDVEAQQILEALHIRYGKLTSYSFKYNATIDIPNSTKKENFSGQYVVKGNQFYININKLDIKSDGKSIANINHETKEVQINPLVKKNKIETPFDFIKNYKKLFKYRVKEVLKANVKVLELIPLEKNSNIFKIDLTINTKDNVVMGSKIYERSGVRVSYAISSREENKAVASSLFSFLEKDYKGYEFLDMR